MTIKILFFLFSPFLTTQVGIINVEFYSKGINVIDSTHLFEY